MASNNGKNKTEFGTPQKVYDLCEIMADIEDRRARERSRINSLMNGQRPYTKSEAEKYNIEINVNWQEGKRIMMDAQRQLNNALLHPGILFNAACESGPEDKRTDWSTTFTKLIHVPIQRGRSGKRWHFTVRSRNATICVHGIGALLWTNDFRWMPRFVPLEDLLIPTDTFCDFSNLRYFAVNLYLSPGELLDMAAGDTVRQGWNKTQVNKILEAQKDLYTESMPSTWKDQPEYMKQIHDQNKGWYWNDALPKIKLRAFYWQDIKVPGKWYRHIIQRETYGEAKISEWVYDGGEQPFANNVDHILNVQYGDGNIIAPLKYHSVRGLGMDLFAPVETINRLRCEFLWSVFEHMKMLFLIKDPADRDRLKQVMLQQFGFIPEGLTVVPRDQRHQIDPRLIESAMAQTRQIMQESSASFVQNPNDGTQKEMTAFEAHARLNQVNVMVSGMLALLYLQEGFLYEEIVRRFRNPRSEDPEVKQFRQKCLAQGIPEDILDNGDWKVTPERVLGGGDRTLAQQQAAWLFQNRTAYGPTEQQAIMRMVTTTMLDDPGKGHLLVPSAPDQPTEGTFAAESVFGTLMSGVPVSLRPGIDEQGYIEGLLKMAGSVIQRITAMDNVGTQTELIGLVTVIQNVSQHIMVLAQDPAEKQRTKQYGDAVGQMTNLIKAFAQRQAAQKQQAQPQGDPKAAAAAQATIMTAQVKAQIQAQKAQQKQREREIEFQLDQVRENMKTISEIRREEMQHRQKLVNQSMEATLDALRGASQITDSGSEET